MDVLRLRSEALEWRQVDGEVIAVDLRRSVYLSANDSGALLWRALAEGTTRDQLVQALRDAFELEAEQADADVDAFLVELAEHDLLDETTA